MSIKNKINLQKNSVYTAKVVDFGNNGEGICKIDGQTVFVPFAIVGEEIEFVIILVKPSFAIGKLLSVIKTSPNRVSAPCQYFGKCGGCQLQHMTYASQLKFKQNLVKNSLQKYAGYTGDVQPVLASDSEYNYRNKFAFPVEEVNGELVVGMYRTASHNIVPIAECKISLESKIAIEAFLSFAKQQNLHAYSAQNSTGVRHIVCRIIEGSILFTIVSTSNISGTEVLQKLLQTKFKNVSVVVNINKKPNNVILGEKDIVCSGCGELKVEEYGLSYPVGVHSFMQVNTPVKHKLYNLVLQQISNGDNVIDAYSGVGVLSSIIAKKASHVYAIEIVKQAVENAENLKAQSAVVNLTNICGDCKEELPKICKKLSNFVLVLDPPRKGCDSAVLKAALEASPTKIIYISCNPATLARDLAVLMPAYNIELVQPADMFPQTANVETLVVLTKKA